MKWKLDRIISVATLAASLIAIFLVLKKPQPVAPAQSPAAAAANVQSLENKLEQLEHPAPAHCQRAGERPERPGGARRLRTARVPGLAGTRRHADELRGKSGYRMERKRPAAKPALLTRNRPKTASMERSAGRKIALKFPD